MKRYLTFKELFAEYLLELPKNDWLLDIYDRNSNEYLGYIDPDLLGSPCDPTDTSITGQMYAKFTVEEDI
jgi:hypothetical protein